MRFCQRCKQWHPVEGEHLCQTPKDGHTFRFTVQSRGSSRIWPEGKGPGPYTDDPEFMGEPWTLEVRAWNLHDALRLAAEQPLNAWDMGEEDGSEPVKFADLKPEPARALVRDPNDRLWLLGEDGRVNREVSREELDSWAAYEDPAPVVDGPLTLILPSRYVGIPYSISRVDWAEFARLGGPPPGPPNPPRAPHDRPYA